MYVSHSSGLSYHIKSIGSDPRVVWSVCSTEGILIPLMYVSHSSGLSYHRKNVGSDPRVVWSVCSTEGILIPLISHSSGLSYQVVILELCGLFVLLRAS